MPQDIAKKRESSEVVSLTLGIVLLVLAAFLLVYSIFAFIYYEDVIAQAIATGQVSPSENGFEIMSVYMQNCMQYLIFSLLLLGVGWLLISQFMKTTSSAKASIPTVEHDQLDNGAETAEADTESSSFHASADDDSQKSDNDD